MTQTIEPLFRASVAGAERARRPLRPQTLASARQRLNPQVACCLFQAIDALALGLIVLAWPVQHDGWARLFEVLAPGLAVAGLTVAGGYRFPRGERLLAYLSMTSLAFAAACAGAAVIARALLHRAAFAPDAALAASGLAAILALHLVWFAMMRRWRDKGLLTPNIAIIGATPVARDLILELVNGRSAGEANVIGIFDDRHKRAPKDILGVPVLGPVADLLSHRALASVDRIVITVPQGAAARVAQLVERLSALPHEIVLVVGQEDRRAVGLLGALNVARLGGHRVTARRAALKRAQDVILAGIALLAALPIFAGVALAVLLDSPGPVFFRQKRHGFNNEEFWVLKFRSMRADAADATAARQVVGDDDRVTRVGRFIRKTSLDELPQLINVLRGEMSLVGPRPHAVGMKSSGADAAGLVNSYSHRHRLKPGLTGLAAVRGSRGPVDDVEALQRRVTLDLTYIERQSFWLDLWIMANTLPLMLGDRAAVR